MLGHRRGWKMQEVGGETVLPIQGEMGTVAILLRSRPRGQVRVMISVETPPPPFPSSRCLQLLALCLASSLSTGWLWTACGKGTKSNLMVILLSRRAWNIGRKGVTPG